MKRTVLAILLILFAALAQASERVQFDVTTLEERGPDRRVLSQVQIEGPAGTDFDILLDGARFQMKTRFVTDFVDRDGLRVRATLETRRLFGYSVRDLPLYEEDRRQESLRVGFEERLVLLPFGEGTDERLKIEITPSRSELATTLPSGKPRPLSIDILKQSPTGKIRVFARKVPHHYRVQAELRDGTRVVARGGGRLALEAEESFVIEPLDSSGRGALELRLGVDRYSRENGPAVEFHFDVHHPDGSALASNWAGISTLGARAVYRLAVPDAAGVDREFELGLTIETDPSGLAAKKESPR